MIRFVFHFRRSQAHHQGTSVIIIQDTFKDDGFYLKHLQAGSVMSLRSSIEATSDYPVRLHDRHKDPDLVSINMALLPILTLASCQYLVELRTNHSQSSYVFDLLATCWPTTAPPVYIALLRIYHIFFPHYRRGERDCSISSLTTLFWSVPRSFSGKGKCQNVRVNVKVNVKVKTLLVRRLARHPGRALNNRFYALGAPKDTPSACLNRGQTDKYDNIVRHSEI